MISPRSGAGSCSASRSHPWDAAPSSRPPSIFCREGDALVVTKLDRLARSVTHLGTIIAALEAKGVALRILNLGVDSATPTGRLMLNVLGGVAQFEREIMLERQREGIAKAKAAGRYKGRKPTVRARQAEIEALAAEGLSMAATPPASASARAAFTERRQATTGGRRPVALTVAGRR